MRQFRDLDQMDWLMATAPPIEQSIAISKDRRRSESRLRTRLSLATSEVTIDNRYSLEEGGPMIGT